MSRGDKVLALMELSFLLRRRQASELKDNKQKGKHLIVGSDMREMNRMMGQRDWGGSWKVTPEDHPPPSD